MPAGACAAAEDDEADGGIAIAARLLQLVAHGPPGHGTVLAFDDDAQRRATDRCGVERDDEVALARTAARRRRSSPRAPAGGPLPRRAPASISPTSTSKSAPLADERARSVARAAAAASMAVRRSLSCSKPRLTSVRNWWSGEPEPRGIEQQREPRGVAVEVGAQQAAHPPDGRVATLLIEELRVNAAKLPRSPRKRLQRPGQPPVTVGEVLAQHRIHLGSRRARAATPCAAGVSRTRDARRPCPSTARQPGAR